MKNLIYIKFLAVAALHQRKLLLIAFLVLIGSNTVLAQNKIGFAVRGGLNYPCHGQNDLNLHNGYGIEGILSYNFLPQLSLYTGWGYNTFDVEDTIDGSAVDFVSNGYSLGLQFEQPIASSRFSMLVGGGAIYHHLEVESDAGDVLADSGHGLGYQVNFGLGIHIGKSLLITPGFKYRSIERDLAFSERNMRIDLHYLSTGVEIGWAF